MLTVIQNNIKGILVQKGWSIRKLSIALGKDYGQVHKIVSTDPMRGGTEIGTLIPIALLLNVTLDDLITSNGDKN